MIIASPELANYAPSGWPLEVGDTLTNDEFDLLRNSPEWGSLFRDPGVVWVVSKSGPEGAIPFGAWFEPAGDWIEFEHFAGQGEYTHMRYLGHLPTQTVVWEVEDMDIPVSLRGFIDPRDHAFDGQPKKGYRLGLFAVMAAPADEGVSGSELLSRRKLLWRKYVEDAQAVFYGENASW